MSFNVERFALRYIGFTIIGGAVLSAIGLSIKLVCKIRDERKQAKANKAYAKITEDEIYDAIKEGQKTITKDGVVFLIREKEWPYDGIELEPIEFTKKKGGNSK